MTTRRVKQVTTPHARSRLARCALLSFAFVSYFTGCKGTHSVQSTGPSLNETTDWINDTYDRHGMSHRQLMKNGILETQDVRTTTLHIDSCVATLEEKQQPDWPMAAEVVLVSDVQTFNFADIDPARITLRVNSSENGGMLCDESNQTMNCDQADMGLHTRNDRPLIKNKQILEYPKLTGADHRNSAEGNNDTAYLFINDLKYLPRLVAALKREIELCGGKPSPF